MGLALRARLERHLRVDVGRAGDQVRTDLLAGWGGRVGRLAEQLLVRRGEWFVAGRCCFGCHD